MKIDEESVKVALRKVAETLPRPFDPRWEITTRDAMQELGLRNYATLKRYMEANGWRRRLARLNSGRIGEVWRMPDAPDL